MTEKKQLGRGEALSVALGALNDGTFTIPELCMRTGYRDNQIGAAIYRLLKTGRVKVARREGRTSWYERVTGEEQAQNHAIIRAPRSTILDRVLTLLGQFEAQQKEEAVELGRVREENARLRKAMKELAAKL